MSTVRLAINLVKSGGTTLSLSSQEAAREPMLKTLLSVYVYFGAVDHRRQEGLALNKRGKKKEQK